MFWKSVVGKLWITIILLVAFVLLILTILLLQFFETFYVNQAERNLTQTARKMTDIVHSYEPAELAYSIAWEMIDPTASGIIVSGNQPLYPNDDQESGKLLFDYIKQDDQLKTVLSEGKIVKKVARAPLVEKQSQVNNEMILVGVPIHDKTGITGAVFIYQPLDVVGQTTKQTTRIILLSAFIAIILTTVFAFFLSSRITEPLRRMREVAFEVAKGKFDTKVPILTHDEIGELGLAFNRMGHQLELNINALNQEKEQVTSILSSMADGVITLDSKGHILVSNPPAQSFLAAFQYDHKLGSSTDPDIPIQMKQLLDKVISEEHQLDIEIFLQGRSWVVVMSPLYDKKKVRGAVAVLRDMTEERRLDKLREDFIANVSHELRTPLSMLQGYSEAIIDDVASSEEEKKEIAQVIYEESLRMGRLVSELLDLARMEAGHIQLTIEEVDIELFIQRVVRKFQGLAKEKSVELSVSFQEAIGIIRMDQDRIEQVLTNLIDNAIRHTSEHGEVVVIVTKAAGHVEIEVKDTGSGIPEEDLPFVFERFYKADKARTRGKAGTGLGLAIARNIIEAHKGQISVQSKSGEGTTFSFSLPN